MKTVWISAVALMAALAGAEAADLPTKKGAAAAPPKQDCYSDILHYFDTTPADCPLSAYGITFYATVDMGVGYETHGAPFNATMHTGVDELLHKYSYRSLFLPTPNGLSQSQVGVKIKEPLAYGWSVVAEVATGFDPYGFQLANGVGAMAQNDGKTFLHQNSNDDSSRAGQWDNSVAYGGFSHPVFGTITAGRQNSLTLDVVNAYDPMGGSYAFSPIGWSGKVPGAGSTEDARMGTGLRYQVQAGNVRASAMVQLGGYAQNNGSGSEVQFGLGSDFGNLSVDGVYSHATDQVQLGIYNGPIPAGLPSDAFTATLANTDALMLAGKYAWNQWKFFGGGEFLRYSNPSDNHPAGFTNIGGYPTFPGAPAFGVPEDFFATWTGVKYAITERLDVTGAYYLYYQPSFTHPGDSCGPNTKGAAPGFAPQGTASGRCAGYENMFSAMVDYRPLKRVDLYAGVFYQRVSGGIATGYLEPDNFAPTVGVRVRF